MGPAGSRAILRLPNHFDEQCRAVQKDFPAVLSRSSGPWTLHAIIADIFVRNLQGSSPLRQHAKSVGSALGAIFLNQQPDNFNVAPGSSVVQSSPLVQRHSQIRICSGLQQHLDLPVSPIVARVQKRT